MNETLLKSSILKKLFLQVSLLSCVLTVAGCKSRNRVIMPATDSTPPTIELIASREHNGLRVRRDVLTPSSAPVHHEVCLGDVISLGANADDDDGGVLNVEIIPLNLQATCNVLNSSPAIARTRQPLFATKQNLGPNAQPGDKVTKHRYVGTNVDVSGLVFCTAGESVASVSGSFRARGTNYHGSQRSTADYSFRYPPTSFSCINDPCFVPLNATHLDTKDETCNRNRTLHVGAHVARKLIDEGKCLAFPVTDRTVTWYCGSSTTLPHNPNTTDCPSSTNFIRVRRASGSNDFWIECFH